MNLPIILAASAVRPQQVELGYVWQQATPEAKAIIFILLVFSVFAWSIMASKAFQMRRAKKLNLYFENEFRTSKHVLDIFDRRLNVEDCPMFVIYQAGSVEMDTRLKDPTGGSRRRNISLKSMEHVKRTLENAVAHQSIRLESGLIMLAIAVSGAPFLGLLGTVWGVMSAFSYVGMSGHADLKTMAPGVAGALITTVAGLLVAIPSMFGYNWLVHTLRVMTVELDNFAQTLVSKFETEYLAED